MRHMMGALIVMLLVGTAAARAEGPTVVTVAATAKPNFVAVDQTVLNLNVIAGMSYSVSGDSKGTPLGWGTLSVTYLNGDTALYTVRVSPEEWKKLQAEIVAAGNK